MSEAPVRSRVSISLVTYNGMRWLDGCIESVRAQTISNLELLILDNASTDGTRERLRLLIAADPRARLFESEQNLGFAAAHNRTISAVETEFVMLLNQDVELDSGFLAAALAAFDGRPRTGAVQARVRLLGHDGTRTDVIDSTGLEMHRDRRVVARRQTEHEDERDLIGGPVWGVDGPAPVYRRSALFDAREPRTSGGWEILDEDFFMYKEDIDLAWRLRKLGWASWYEPQAVAWHARGAGGSPGRTIPELIRADRTIPRWIKQVSWRNHRLMQVKNETPLGYLRDLPWILRREILSLGFMTVVDPRRLAVIGDLASLMSDALRKRRWLIRRPQSDSAGSQRKLM